MLGKVLSTLKIILLSTSLLTFTTLMGCTGGSGGENTTSTGTLKLAITDKASDDYGSVVISIREIRVVPNGKENAADDDPGLPLVARFSIPRVIDVMQLQFVQQALGEVVLPSGNYNQIRLILEQNPNGQGRPPVNYLTLKSDPTTRIPLTTPSAQQSGVKVLGSIEIKPGIINAVMIDFDPNTAIVARGNGDYNLKPTGIRLVRMSEMLTQYGSLSGTVFSTDRDWVDAVVSVKRRGAINDIDPIAAGRVFANYTSGAWQAPFTAFVPPSTQSISYKTFVTAVGFQIYSSQTTTVIQGASTDLGAVHINGLP